MLFAEIGQQDRRPGVRSGASPRGALSEADGLARCDRDQSPADPVAGERGSGLRGALREVRPAVSVDHGDALSPESDGGLRGKVGGQRQVGAVEPMGELGSAGEQDGDWDWAEPFGDLFDDVKRGVIAGHVDGRVVGCL